MKKLAFLTFLFSAPIFAGNETQIDTSMYMLEMPVYPPAIPTRPPEEVLMGQFKAMLTMRKAIHAKRELDRKRTRQRVNAAVPLCNKLRSAILAGDDLALEACLEVLLK